MSHRKISTKIPSSKVDQSPVDGHARWVSPRVLDIMDTLPADDEVTGGQIIRDVNGKPTGKSLHNLYAMLAQISHRDFCRQHNGSYSITGME